EIGGLAQPLAAGASRRALEALVAQREADQVGDRRLVVHDQDARLRLAVLALAHHVKPPVGNAAARHKVCASTVPYLGASCESPVGPASVAGNPSGLGERYLTTSPTGICQPRRSGGGWLITSVEATEPNPSSP